MSVTIYGATHAASAASASTLSITLPACPAGATLYLLVANNYSVATFTAPSGWTLVDSRNARADNYGWLYTKTASGSDGGSTLSLTFAATANIALIATALSATHDAETSSTNASDVTSLTMPAVTPVASDCLQLGFVSNCFRGGTDTPGISTPAGWTAQAADYSGATSGNNVNVALFTKQLAGQAGTAQPTTTVAVPGNSHSGLMFSVTAAPASPPAPASGAFIWNGTEFKRHTPHLWVAGAWTSADVSS